MRSIFKKIFKDKDDFPSKRVLIIDDSPVDSAISERVLVKKGYDVCKAKNGDDGIAEALRFKPDIILMDYNMPGRNGPEVCHELKGKPETQDIPVIFITSEDTPQTVINSFENGAEVFLTKPLNTHELLMQVRLTLSDRNMINEN